MGYISLLGFLLVMIGIGLVLLFLLFLSQSQSLDPLFLACIAICAVVSLFAGIIILSKN
jgi:hypothetical protein